MTTEIEPPLLTVIVAVFNGQATIQQCINSVAQQTYPRKELIIIDGGSKDGTADFLKLNNEKISYWISEPDQGIYHAWNKGLEHAQGEWICFLGADDQFADIHVLQNVEEKLESSYPEYKIIYGQVKMINALGAEIAQLGAHWNKVKNRFLNGTYCLPTPGVFHHRSVFSDYGKFDQSYVIAGDYELLLRVLRTSNPLYLPDITITFMQQGGISSRPESALISLREMAKARRKHGKSLFNIGLYVAFFRAYARITMWYLLGEKLTRLLLDMGRGILGKPRYWTKH